MVGAFWWDGGPPRSHHMVAYECSAQTDMLRRAPSGPLLTDTTYTRRAVPPLTVSVQYILFKENVVKVRHSLTSLMKFLLHGKFLSLCVVKPHLFLKTVNIIQG